VVRLVLVAILLFNLEILTVKVTRMLALGVLVLSLSVVGVSQNALTTSGASRKVTKRVPPAYPELAKRMGVSGAVKLELTVAASGKVKDVRVIGGHPVLANSASQMAQSWQFEPGAESTEQIVINFTL